MSGPAIAIAVKFVSTFYAMKTAADGVREGNLAKAVIGGVGAYFGATSFGTTAAGSAAGQTAQSEATAALGTEAGNAAATTMQQGAAEAGAQAGGQAAGGAATSAPAATTGLDTAAAQNGERMWTLNDGTNGSLVPANQAPPAYRSFGPGPGGGGGSGGGFLSDASEWINKNQTFAGGAMQLGGNLFAGYAQGEMMQKQIDELRRQENQRRADEEARRRRMEAQGDIGFLQQYSYNPATGMME